MRVLGTCVRARKAVILRRQTTLLFYTGQFNTLTLSYHAQILFLFSDPFDRYGGASKGQWNSF